MRTKYEVWRHHNLIFTGTMNQVKKFLINSGAFSGYEKRIRRAIAVNGHYGDKWDKTIDYACCMTEYCSVKAIDRRKNAKAILEAQSEAQYEVLNAMIEKRKAKINQVFND